MGGPVLDPRIDRGARRPGLAFLAMFAWICDLVTWCLLMVATVALLWGRPLRGGPRRAYYYYSNLHLMFLVAIGFYLASLSTRCFSRWFTTGKAEPDERITRWLAHAINGLTLIWFVLLGLSLPSRIDAQAAFVAATLALVNPIALILISFDFLNRYLRRRNAPT